MASAPHPSGSLFLDPLEALLCPLGGPSRLPGTGTGTGREGNTDGEGGRASGSEGHGDVSQPRERHLGGEGEQAAWCASDDGADNGDWGEGPSTGWEGEEQRQQEEEPGQAAEFQGTETKAEASPSNPLPSTHSPLWEDPYEPLDPHQATHAVLRERPLRRGERRSRGGRGGAWEKGGEEGLREREDFAGPGKMTGRSQLRF